MNNLSSSKRSSFLQFFGVTAALLCLGSMVRGQNSESVFVTLATTAQTAGSNAFPPVPIVINGPASGWPYSAAAPVPGTTWNKAYRPSVTPTASGTFTEDAPFIINTLNDAPLYSSDGALSSIRLTGAFVGTFTRAEPGYIAVSGAVDTTELLNSVWRVYSSTAYLRFRFSGLVPNAHYYLYVYSSTANQGGKYILHPSNFPAGRTSTYIYPGATAADQLPTNFVDLTGWSGSLTLFRLDAQGNRTIIAPAATNTPGVTGSNKIWGAMPAVATAAGEITFRTDTSAWDGRRQYAGFQLIRYPNPTITEQPDSEMVGVLAQTTELFAVAKDMPNISDADQNPLTYQWQISRDNAVTWTDIPLADPTAEGVHLGTSTIRTPADVALPAQKVTSVLTINATQRSDEAKYRLRVTNIAGGITYSSASTLTVINQPAPFSITQQPRPASVVVGDNVNLSVAVTGTPSFQFVWQKSATADFATYTVVKTGTRGPTASDTLAFSPARRSDLGYYRAVITDVTRRNPIYSDIVYLYVEYAPPIITPSGRQAVAPGNTISLFGNAYTEIPITRFQWQVSHNNGTTWADVTDGGSYSGATTEILYISNSSSDAAGLYRLVATNAQGTTTGGTISVAVTAPVVAHPVSVAPDDAGNLYVTDDTSNAVYQITLDNSVAVLFAGKAGTAGHADGSYGQATFNAPVGAIAGGANTLFLADTLNGLVRYVQANGSVQTLAGSSVIRSNTDGTGTAAAFNAPVGVGVDAAGNLYVADNVAHTIRRITPLNFDVTTLAGSAGTSGNANASTTNSDNNAGSLFNAPRAVAVSPVNLAAAVGGTATVETPLTTATTIYVADTGNNVIRKIALTWYLDRDPITNVQTRTRISASAVTTVAGLAGVAGSADGSGTTARFNSPTDLTVDAAGDIYVADTGSHTVRKIVITAGVAQVTTVAGLPGISGYQDGPTAATSRFNQPRGVRVDPAGNVYVADTGNAAVRKIDAVSGKISTLVLTRGTDPVPASSSSSGGSSDAGTTIPTAGKGDGKGEFGTGGGGAPSHWFLAGLALLACVRIRRQIMKMGGLVCLGFVALLGTAQLKAQTSPAFVGQTGGAPTVVVGKQISLRTTVTGFVSLQWQRNLNGAWTDLSNGGSYSGSTTDTLVISNVTSAAGGQYRLAAMNGSGSNLSEIYTLTVAPLILSHATGVAVDAFGNLYIADSAANVVRKVTSGSTKAALYAGIPSTAGYQDGAFGMSTLNSPGALAIDASSNLYVTDVGNAIVRVIARDGAITTLAGDPTQRGSSDGIGTAATFVSPNGTSFDRTNGVTYIADTNNHTIRRLTPQALQSGIFVGNVVLTIGGSAGLSGDADGYTLSSTGAQLPTRFNHPAAVAFGGTYIYVADTGNNTIRRINAAVFNDPVSTEARYFLTTTFSGIPGVTGSADGNQLAALFNQPQAIVVDTVGANIYVADTGNNTIRRITSAGVVTTLAGIPGISGLADGPGGVAMFDHPLALAIDVAGTTLYVADTGNAAIRKIVISGNSATVSTVSVTSSDNTLPANGSISHFSPTIDSHAGGGGGAPSLWYFAMFIAVAITRRVIRRR